MADSGPSHHALEIGEVAAQLAVDITCGLSTAEAAERQHKFGLNHTPVMNTLFHTAPIGTESWLRIVAVALVVFTLVEFEKWLRYGRGRGEHVLPE